MSETHVKGLAELNKFLQTVSVKLEKNIMSGALRAGIKPIKQEAQAQLASHGNVVTGELSKGLKVSTRTRGGVVRSRLRATGKRAFIAHMLEFTGAVPHEIRPKKARSLFIAGLFGTVVQHPGFSAKPFMRPALDARAGQAVVATGEYIKKRLTKEGLNVAEVVVEADA
jgi:hypothetical protein